MVQGAGLKVEHTEKIIKRHDFASWVERQGCAAEVIERLLRLLQNAPEPAARWLQPQDVGEPGATFANHHLIISGRKA
jgi:hypothetical protein